MAAKNAVVNSKFGERKLGKDGKAYRQMRTPLAKQLRIKAKYMTGNKSINKIAEEEHADFQTVKRIVSEEHQADYIKQVRAEFIGAAQDALALLISGMAELKDPNEKCQMAMKLLEVQGVILPAQTKHAVAVAHFNQPQQIQLPPQQEPNPQAPALFKNQNFMELAHQAALVGVLRHETYGTQLPDVEQQEVKHAEELAAHEAESGVEPEQK